MSANLEAEGVRSNRIQNLAITVNKVLYVLSKNRQHHIKPMRYISSKEMLIKLYLDKDDSLTSKMLTNIIDYIQLLIKKGDTKKKIKADEMKLKKKRLKQCIIDIKAMYITIGNTKKGKKRKKSKLSSSSSTSSNNVSDDKLLQQAKQVMLNMALKLTEWAQDTNLMSSVEGRCLISAADTLFFYAKTKRHFTSNAYTRKLQ